ncbi:ABC transporter substrate-binding protein [Magnetospira thiophila]
MLPSRLCFLLLFGWLALIPQARADHPLRLALSMTPLSAPFIIALEKGFFDDQGLEVSVLRVQGGHRAAREMLDGRADVATSSETVVMFNSFENRDFGIVCTFVNTDNDIKLITRRDTGIRTVDDLAFHKVGTIMGASAHFFLDEALLLHQVDRSTVEIVKLQPEEMADSLLAHKVDAVVVWEPFAHLILKRLGEEAVVLPHDRTYIETFNALATRHYAQGHAKNLEKMVRGLFSATRFLFEHEGESQRIVANYLGKNMSVIQPLWEDLNFEISLHQWLITTLEREARWAMSHQLVEGKEMPNYLQFLYPETLDSIRPRAVTIFR